MEMAKQHLQLSSRICRRQTRPTVCTGLALTRQDAEKRPLEKYLKSIYTTHVTHLNSRWSDYFIVTRCNLGKSRRDTIEFNVCVVDKNNKLVFIIQVTGFGDVVFRRETPLFIIMSGLCIIIIHWRCWLWTISLPIEWLYSSVDDWLYADWRIGQKFFFKYNILPKRGKVGNCTRFVFFLQSLNVLRPIRRWYHQKWKTFKSQSGYSFKL